MSDDANESNENDRLQELLSRLPPKDSEEPEESHPEETETPQDAFREEWRPTVFSERDKPEHEKQELDYKGTPVQIDIQLVPLIQRLWAKQWGEVDPCYNSSKLHLAYIHFETPEHAHLFFDAIANHVSLRVWDRRGIQGATIRFPTDEIAAVTDLFPADINAGN